MNRRQFIWRLSSGVIISTLSFLAGCGKPTKYYFNPYISKNLNSPEVVHCFSSIGHKKGTHPFIMGGTCCCTPTQELMDLYHSDGILLDYDLNKLLKEYEKIDIVLRHENGWQCNNQCPSGPHIVFGGKCMVPPTIGTQNFENVIRGIQPKT